MTAALTIHDKLIRQLAELYGLQHQLVQVTALGGGLINHTWKLETSSQAYILQRINTSVFRQPQAIAQNIRIVSAYLASHYPEYLFPAPVPTLQGNEMPELEEEGFFRLFRFIPGSHSISVVDTPQQAFEAAAQFGRFTRLLRDLPVDQLAITLPDFHNLSMRYRQFLAALRDGNRDRMAASEPLIRQLTEWSFIVQEYEKIRNDPAFRVRVTHHDTKISNVLLDDENRGLCVIDLDTVMPGLYLSDAGDMLRTYLSPVSEEEKDLSAIRIRFDIFEAVAAGYLGEMKSELTAAEGRHFIYAGQFMIYMQAIRFLTDHLLNDSYYGARYAGHNYYRAANQAALLDLLLQNQQRLEKLTHRFLR